MQLYEPWPCFPQQNEMKIRVSNLLCVLPTSNSWSHCELLLLNPSALDCPCWKQKSAGAEKTFPHEYFKRSYSNCPGLFPFASSICHRWRTLPSPGQTSNIPHRSPAIQGFFHPQSPEPRGNTQDLESQAWKQLTGMKLSGREWVWSDRSRAFGNTAGINLAPWLCSVESTAGIYKQITHWMLSYGSRAKSPGHAKETVTTPKGRQTTFTVCFSPGIIFNRQKSFTG